MTRRMATFVLAVCVLGLSVSRVEAQDGADPTRGEPTGIRDSARLFDEPSSRARAAVGIAAAPAPIRLFLIPSLTWADGITVGGATVGYINRANPDVPLQVRFGYRRLDADEGADRDRVSVDGKATFALATDASLAAMGEYRRTLSASRRYSAGVAADNTFDGKVNVSANVGYVNTKPDSAGAVEDVVPGVGVALLWSPSTTTSFDYTFKNDVDGEYNVSFTLTQWLTSVSKFGPLKLNFGMARHRAVFVSVSQPFRSAAAR